MARELGFDACGIAAAGPVDAEAAARYDRWIAQGHHDTMEWAARWRDVRDDPRLLLDGARSLIVVALNYRPQRFQPPQAAQVAAYAYGRDYHKVVKQMLRPLARHLEAAGHRTRMCVDSAPLRERYWAVQAGVGFVGINNQLIIPGRGSYFFLGTLLTTLPLPPDEPCTLTCRGCRACVEACPGHALSDDGSAVDARRCLSCLTIEHEGPLPTWAGKVMGNHLMGCDECLKCCPHNARAVPTAVERFAPPEALFTLTGKQLEEMTEDEFLALFGHTPMRRAGLARLRHTAEISHPKK